MIWWVKIHFSCASTISKWDIQELNEAVKSGSERDVNDFLKSNPTYNINTLDEDGFGAIHYAFDSPNPVSMMELLIGKGADINLRTPNEETGRKNLVYPLLEHKGTVCHMIPMIHPFHFP